MLIECEYIGFGYLNYLDVDIKIVIYWVEESIKSGFIDDQGVYLFVFFG